MQLAAAAVTPPAEHAARRPAGAADAAAAADGRLTGDCMRKTVMPWLVALMLGAALHSSANSAPNEWNEYINRRLHFSVHYPETYRVVADLSTVVERKNPGTGSSMLGPTWKESSLVGSIQFTSGGGGLVLNIDVYTNRDTLSLEEAADRVLEPIRSLRDYEDNIDSFSINGEKALRIDVYCAPNGKQLRYSRYYIVNAWGLIYAVSFANPEYSAGPMDLIGTSEEQIAEIVSSFEWTFWVR